MAGGKLTPRQKMINLMYLVFIAMLALNMSKEVLSAFGLMNEKFEATNNSSKLSNEQMLMALDQKAAEAKGTFAVAAVTAHKVEAATKKFYAFVESVKGDITKGFPAEESGKLPYEAMDKSTIDEVWFSGDGYSAKGKEIISAIEAYKKEIQAALGSEKKYTFILNDINKKFDLADVKNHDGAKVKFLDYHFKGFPAIATIAKLSAWQNDAKKGESDVISAALGKAAVETASYSKYQAIVVLDKNAFFTGEKVTGKVVLGRYDENTKPKSVTGASLDPATGQAKINLTAGSVGEQNIGGSFTFIEDNKTINLPFKGTYVVVPRPNSATISADKMNVVYRGVDNPMTISFAGVSNDKVRASAPGMSGSNGKYVLRPGSGSTVMVTVSATLPDGSTVADKKEFRIKGIPAPTGKIRGEVSASGAKSNLEVCTITAELVDFDFPIKAQVTQFTIKVPGQPSKVVSGSKMDAAAKSAIAKASKGDVVSIFDIKAKFVGGAEGQLVKGISPCSFEIK